MATCIYTRWRQHINHYASETKLECNWSTRFRGNLGRGHLQIESRENVCLPVNDVKLPDIEADLLSFTTGWRSNYLQTVH